MALHITRTRTSGGWRIPHKTFETLKFFHVAATNYTIITDRFELIKRSHFVDTAKQWDRDHAFQMFVSHLWAAYRAQSGYFLCLPHQWPANSLYFWIMPNFLSTRLKHATVYISIIQLLTLLSCQPNKKTSPETIHDFNIDSFITTIKSDTTLAADDAKFDKTDSLLIIYLIPRIPYNDSGAMRSHFKSLHITSAIRRAKNISGIVFVKTPPADSLRSENYQYQILSSFFKAGTKFAEKNKSSK